MIKIYKRKTKYSDKRKFYTTFSGGIYRYGY